MISIWRYDSQLQQVLLSQKVGKRTNLAIVTDVTREQFREWCKNGIPGNVVRTEYLESQLPQEYISQKHLFLKTAGMGGPVFTKNGENIYTICEYDPTGKKEDLIIQHDKILGGQRH